MIESNANLHGSVEHQNPTSHPNTAPGASLEQFRTEATNTVTLQIKLKHSSHYSTVTAFSDHTLQHLLY